MSVGPRRNYQSSARSTPFFLKLAKPSSAGRSSLRLSHQADAHESRMDTLRYPMASTADLQDESTLASG